MENVTRRSPRVLTNYYLVDQLNTPYLRVKKGKVFCRVRAFTHSFNIRKEYASGNVSFDAVKVPPRVRLCTHIVKPVVKAYYKVITWW